MPPELEHADAEKSSLYDHKEDGDEGLHAHTDSFIEEEGPTEERCPISNERRRFYAIKRFGCKRTEHDVEEDGNEEQRAPKLNLKCDVLFVDDRDESKHDELRDD